MAKRPEPVRNSDDRRRGSAGTRSAPGQGRAAAQPPLDAGAAPRPRSAPHTSPIPRITDAPARPKNAAQAKARSKARKAKAPKVVRLPLRERLLVKLSSIDLDPRRLVTRVPFVVLVIGALGLGLAVTLWLSTDAAERSYQLGHVTGDQSGTAAAEGGAGARRAGGAGRTGPGRGGAQPRHDPVQGHRPSGAGPVGQLDGRRHAQAGPGGSAATLELAAARDRPARHRPPRPRRASSTHAR